MDVALRKGLDAGHSHQRRLAIAHQLTEQILARHGDRVAAIVLFGFTAVGGDGPYSDLDMAVVTHEDLGAHSKCYPCRGLQINLDYQTVEESFEEAREPHTGGCWPTCIPLYDPAGLTRQFAAAYQALGPRECQEAFLRVIRDDLSVVIGKIRNSVVAADRASFLHALCAFSQAACRGLCMVNGNRAVAANARLIAEARSLPVLPPRFAELIDVISGVVAVSDQTLYDSVEELWAGVLGIVAQRGLRWVEPELLV
jgi:hypothetical protein